MTVEECYGEIGGNYGDVISRLRTDERVMKFLGKVASDPSFTLLTQSLENRNLEEAFRAAHTIKGVSMNLSLTRLYESAEPLTEALRGRTQYGDDLIPLYDALKSVYLQTTEKIQKLLG